MTGPVVTTLITWPQCICRTDILNKLKFILKTYSVLQDRLLVQVAAFIFKGTLQTFE